MDVWQRVGGWRSGSVNGQPVGARGDTLPAPEASHRRPDAAGTRGTPERDIPHFSTLRDHLGLPRPARQFS